ncbi:MAG: hypothetical protein ACQEXJ_20135 [Myxococcota bacterium]
MNPNPRELSHGRQRRCLICVLRGSLLSDRCVLLRDLRDHLGPDAPCAYRETVLSDLRKIVYGSDLPLTYDPDVYADISRGAALAALEASLSG